MTLIVHSSSTYSQHSMSLGGGRYAALNDAVDAAVREVCIFEGACTSSMHALPLYH